MELLLLLVLIGLYLAGRRRDRQRREELTARLDSLESGVSRLASRVYALEGTKPAIEQRIAAPATAKAVAKSPGPSPPPVAPPPVPVRAGSEKIPPAPIVPPPPRVPTPPAAPPTASKKPQEAVPVALTSIPPAPKVPPSPPITPARPLRERFTLELEQHLGANWLNKLGVTILVLGVSFFLAYQLGEMGPAGKVLVGYLVGGGLLAGSILLERRERYEVFARAGIGGAWALLFFTTYAMHHVEAARVLDSRLASLLLMLLVAAAMTGYTLRYRSQVVTGLALLLAFWTVNIGRETVYSLTAGMVLALALVVIAGWRRWYELEVFGLLATYLNHFFWLRTLVEDPGFSRQASPELNTSSVILLSYWAIFRASYLWRHPEPGHQEQVSTLAALLNTSLLLGLLKYQAARPDLAFWTLLGVGVAELVLGQLPLVRQRRTAFVVLSSLGATLIVASIPFRYGGAELSFLWLILAQAYFFAGVLTHEPLFRRFGVLAGILAAVQILAVSPSAEAGGLQASLPLTTAALLFYANAQAAPRRWAELLESRFDFVSLRVLCFLAGLLALVAAWVAVGEAWVAVAWAALGWGLAGLGRRLDEGDLYLQGVILSAAAFLRGLAVNFDLPGWAEGSTVRLVTVSLVAGLFYLSTRWADWIEPQKAAWVRATHTSAAALLILLLAYSELAAAWTAVSWAAYGVVLVWAGWRWKRADLSTQGNLLGLVVFFRVLVVNLDASESYGLLTLRLVTVSFVIGLLYLLSRWSKVDATDWGGALPILHRSAAAFLLAALALSELASPWVAVSWVGLALLLGVLGRTMRLSDLTIQAKLLAAAAFAAVLIVNLGAEEPFHAVTLRLLTASLVAAMLYAFSRWSEARELKALEQFPAAYTWAASLVIGLLLWYELEPASVALGWGLLGLVLFEIGLARRSEHMRFQGYVALGAAFARVLVANLNIDVVADPVSPRLYTTLPLALLYFYIYDRLFSQTENFLEWDRQLRVAEWHCYLGTLTLAAVFRFEVDLDWVVASWAMLLLVLLAVAWHTGRRIFLHQAMLLAAAIAFRTLLHNFYQRSHFPAPPGYEPLLTVGTTAVLLFLGLLFAFRLRERGNRPTATDRPLWQKGILAWLDGRPEQVLFFVPFVLLTVLLALELPRGLVTMSWGLLGLTAFLFALRVGERSYRLAGLALLLLCVAKILVLDVWDLHPRDRYLTFIVLGLALMLVSFFYSRHREVFRRYL